MNKFGFLSLVLTTLLYFLQFIPVGFYFQPGYPFINCYIQIPLQLFTYGGIDLFIWGIESNGVFQFWFEINLLTGLFFIILTPIAILLTLFGFLREKQSGKKLMNANLIIILVIFLYAIIGLPIYSGEILGVQFGYLDIFFFTNYGFYLLLLNLIIAGISYWKHPINK